MFRRVLLIVIAGLASLVFLTQVVAALESSSSTMTAARTASTTVRAASSDEQRHAVRQGAIYLARVHQNDDGGYAAFSMGANQAPSSIVGTVDVILAQASAGYAPSQFFPGKSATPLSFLSANPTELARFARADGAQAGKLILALMAAGEDPRTFAGFDAVMALIDQAEPAGTYGVADAFKQSLAVLGLAAVNEPIPDAAWQWLVAGQSANGSWDDGFGTAGNPDASAMAIMALLAAGRPVSDPALVAGRDFLASAQLPDGSWEYGSGFGGSPNSTGLVIQALSALGEVWYTDSGPWTQNGTNPLESLLAFQGSSGAFQADFGQGPFDDFFATVQALPAAAGRPLPLPSRSESSRRALTCLESLQDDQSGGWEQFAGFGVNAAGTARAIEAIRAGGGDPQDARWTTSGGINAVETLETTTPNYLTGGRGGRAGVVTQGVVAAGPPYASDSFAGIDLPLQISGYLSPTGEYDNADLGISAHAEAMLGLLAAGADVDSSAIAFLLSAQQDGEWGSPDQNGAALNVLGRLAVRLPAGVLDIVRDTQLANGGWGFEDDANPSSTSEIAQGLVSVGENPFGPAWSEVVDGRLTNPADVVISQQGSNGCWPNTFGPGDDPFSTTDAILLLNLNPSWDVPSIRLPVISGSGAD